MLFRSDGGPGIGVKVAQALRLDLGEDRTCDRQAHEQDESPCPAGPALIQSSIHAFFEFPEICFWITQEPFRPGHS